MSEIAVFSTSIDEPTYGIVAEKLADRGYDVWLYLADRVASGLDSAAFTVSDSYSINIVYNGSTLDLCAIQSAWFRHPNLFNFNFEDKAKQQSIESEITGIQESLWQAVPLESWLNSPGKMRAAGAKIYQLAIAKQVGFNIPTSIVSNDWEHINGFLGEEEIIVKMNTGLLYTDDVTKAFYTNVLNKESRSRLEPTLPYPAIFQRFLHKKREWRVTVVGQDIFEAAVYTEDAAKDDWRVHQLTSKVQFRKEVLPESERQVCINYLGRLGLNYGAFDLVEDYDGKFTFLECNPNGQYRWLEELLGLPISDAIADKLITIYRDNN